MMLPTVTNTPDIRFINGKMVCCSAYGSGSVTLSTDAGSGQLAGNTTFPGWWAMRSWFMN